MTTEEIPVTDEFLITKQFKTAAEFSIFIEKLARDSRSPCMDILIDYCEKRNIEVSSVAGLISSSLKEKIRVEAQQLNMLKNDDGILPL
jgi:hypothetical protein